MLQNRAFHHWKALIHSKKGEMIWEPIMITLVVVVLILNSMHLLEMMVKYQKVQFIAKQVCRTVELNGEANGEAYSMASQLSGELKTNTTVSISASGQIQFRDPFSVTARDVYEMKILTPAFAKKPVTIKIPIKAQVNGMSEVYWKTEDGG